MKSNKNSRFHISLMSWNIQDSVGDGSNKFLDQNFLDILQKANIVCLQETKKLVKIEGYISFNSNRKNSRSGGVCILAENWLRKGVSLIPCNECDDIVVAKLDKNFFRLDFDLYLVCFYISPPYSSYAKKTPDYTEKTFAALNNICSKLRQKGEVAMCGDSNARTGTLPDFISSSNAGAVHDIYNDIGLPIDCNEARNNQDTSTIEPHCQLFLDTVINNQLKILNGRTLGDSTGKLTCHKSNGSSLVDYFLISSWAREHVNSLQVKEFTSYSDHCPLVLCLTTYEPFADSCVIPDFATMPNGFKWDNNNSPRDFMAALNDPDLCASLTGLMDTEFPCTVEGNKLINNTFINCIHRAAESSLKVKKPPKVTPHKKWFDFQCRLSKRNLNRLANRLGNHHTNKALRKEYYSQRNKHTNLVNKRKLEYLRLLNQAIEDGHVLDWKKFKRLKQENDSSPNLDKYDLASFHEFFSSLYSKPAHEPSLSCHFAEQYTQPPDLSILNDPITLAELTNATKQLKKGKSCSTDQITNEMLQNLTPLCTKAILKTFNHSLTSGLYPWHTSVITPIFKSGNPFSPDNYRAIAVGSCMGKLFSSILLDRMLHFKNLYCPDPKEQLGFCKGAQTNDHIFTLKTVIDKYTRKHKVRVYACFVDLRKAFDTVCRDLLLHKITCLGISGNFFNCLTDMYLNSVARIKISKLLTPNIEIGRGTEQGHPLSPDLFKIYIQKLSSLLKSSGDYPTLTDIIISHLLWADDLVLLALSPEALQENIDILLQFCQMMGLEINVNKTKVITFNPPRSKAKTHQFMLGSTPIKNVDNYCYLGIIFHKSGTFRAANAELRAKALRALYGLKGNIIKNALSYKSLISLFDCLVKPILLYGCQVLTPHSKTVNYIARINDQSDPTASLKYLAQDHYEKFHLKFLKWALSVHSKASNVGCWGETGRHPLIYEALKLSIDYFFRVKHSNHVLVSAAFHEQADLDLPWFSNTSKILDKFSCSNHNPKAKVSTSTAHMMREEFVSMWKLAKASSPKLNFYHQIKHEFLPEKYLSLVKIPEARNSLTRFRISSHNLFIERGRYETPIIPRENRWCLHCYFTTGVKTLEDEIHALATCPLYNVVRGRFGFSPDQNELIDSLSDQSLTPAQATTIAKTIHAILSINEKHVEYYKSPHFHNNCGSCVLL